MAKYLVRAPQFRPLTDGDVSPVGEVVISQDGNEWTLQEVDDETILRQAQNQGDISDYKPESILTVLGEIHPKAEPEMWGNGKGRSTKRKVEALENRMGVDFPTWGITPEWQDIVGDGTEIIVGVADTGRVPQAAMDAHAPGVEFIHVWGGDDKHGHQTACVLRIIGRNGVLNRARRIVTAQALPGANGAGTTQDIVNSIRALRNWRGPQGERVKVISLSLGMDQRDGVIDREIIDTQNEGVICSAAMGNSGWNIRSTGTPAAVCLFSWGATNFDGSQPASFSTGGSNLPEEDGTGPGENVGLAHLDGGYGTGNGTSFSNPVGAATIAGGLAVGMTVNAIKEYYGTHQKAFNPARRVGLLQLNAIDYAGGNTVPNPETSKFFDEIIWRAQEMDTRLAQAQNFREALQNGTMSWDNLFNSSLGPGRDLMREVVELANSGKV